MYQLGEYDVAGLGCDDDNQVDGLGLDITSILGQGASVYQAERERAAAIAAAKRDAAAAAVRAQADAAIARANADAAGATAEGSTSRAKQIGKVVVVVGVLGLIGLVILRMRKRK